MTDAAQELGATEMVWLDTSPRRRAEMLDQNQRFASFGSKELHWNEIETLARFMSAYSVSKGKVIFLEGARQGYMGLIVDGSVEIVKEASSQKKKVLVTLNAGKAVGEMSLVDGEPRSATAIAAEDTTVLVLTKANFDRLSTEYPRLALRVLTSIAKLLSRRLRETSGLLVDYLER